jgi:hypothetical protein
MTSTAYAATYVHKWNKIKGVLIIIVLRQKCYSHTRFVIGPVFQLECGLVAITLPQGGINNGKKIVRKQAL